VIDSSVAGNMQVLLTLFFPHFTRRGLCAAAIRFRAVIDNRARILCLFPGSAPEGAIFQRVIGFAPVNKPAR